MTKFEKININFFTAFFALAAVIEFIGFLSGFIWCLYAAILCALVSIMISVAAKHDSKSSSKTNRNV